MKLTTMIYLHDIQYDPDELLQQIPKITKRKVPAHKKSVKAAEFYKAAQQGLKPEIVFEIRESEYRGESEAAEGKNLYTVIRAGNTERGTMELVCSKKGAGENERYSDRPVE